MVCFTYLAEGFSTPVLKIRVTNRVVITGNRSCLLEIAGLGATYVNPFNFN